MSIEVKNITKTYGEQNAVDQVSFKVKKGEVVGFLGPNGAGKSTTMKIITGYLPATEGEAFVCDTIVDAENIATQKKIGYLPETNPMYLDMYVREYLAFCAGVHGLKGKAATERIEEVIQLTGLTPESKKIIGSLSKGYKQRVGLAQALLHNPEVLILDEPTSGLDPNQIVEIRNLISKAGEEKTVLLSTHIMQEVEAMCDRVIIINQGKIVANDKLKNLQEKHGNKSLEDIFRTLTKSTTLAESV
jgi:ABC-2 type transport system ATP-binding protein